MFGFWEAKTVGQDTIGLLLEFNKLTLIACSDLSDVSIIISIKTENPQFLRCAYSKSDWNFE